MKHDAIAEMKEAALKPEVLEPVYEHTAVSSNRTASQLSSSGCFLDFVAMTLP